MANKSNLIVGSLVLFKNKVYRIDESEDLYIDLWDRYGTLVNVKKEDVKYLGQDNLTNKEDTAPKIIKGSFIKINGKIGEVTDIIGKSYSWVYVKFPPHYCEKYYYPEELKDAEIVEKPSNWESKTNKKDRDKCYIEIPIKDHSFDKYVKYIHKKDNISKEDLIHGELNKLKTDKQDANEERRKSILENGKEVKIKTRKGKW